ncbi:hypothetical protein [Rhizobium leguminosarum]|jgi:hypothetical protein|uniref:hypothetical protein n=1 Tax=Rhizobium leguminosarum TaxID=384 RepID=UPI00037FA66E|nr:hypothetical protein [Rhizobium leguminosarum]ASS58942.1 hypothetical protein CHR56_30825 [Rhizobium leguminosarum bv. viciae]MBB4332072.1 hypothetical protein [Rhizobium leguminosarum]MBB4357697.1 hypothetical protein [Rhizobium leguminosarum]MBB4386242.1 hypothetical protein [Rhizobium leguminosarum]MBB4466654.1 hypothetical protein [Rhizobium leguminosarum]
MASPWNLLARLISLGRGQKRENGSTEKVTPDALAISGPTETPAEESPISAARPASEELPRHDQAAAISAVPVHSEEAENDVRDKVDGDVAKMVEVANPAISGGTGIDVTAAHDTPRIKRTVEVAPRKQRSRGKEAVAIANDRQAIHTANEMSLDDEIKVLRDQLARKLTLQNAQLRKMLDRFER